MLEYNMLAGESRYVTLTLASRKNEPIIVASAMFDLYNDVAGAVTQSGSCEINDKTLRVLLSPPGAGVFTLLITYTLPPEIRKAAVKIYVKEGV